MPNKELFTEYLLRVAEDHEDSGAEFTAEDYRWAAQRIERAALALERLEERDGMTDGARRQARRARLALVRPLRHTEVA